VAEALTKNRLIFAHIRADLAELLELHANLTAKAARMPWPSAAKNGPQYRTGET